MSRGPAIEAESFRMIEQEIGGHGFPPSEFPLVRRVIHATADFEIGRSLVFSNRAVAIGLEALSGGCPIITDVQMVASGISRLVLKRAGGGEVLCRIGEKEAQELSASLGVTRAAAAMRLCAPMISRSIVVIGNAPTALREVLRLYEQEGIRPRLLIAVPVGFVDAAESKASLLSTSLIFITNRGRKGGTPAATALINALLHLCAEGISKT